MSTVTEADAAAVARAASGEMDPALAEAIGMLARMRAERDELEAENGRLKRRIAEEDARIARG